MLTSFISLAPLENKHAIHLIRCYTIRWLIQLCIIKWGNCLCWLFFRVRPSTWLEGRPLRSDLMYEHALILELDLLTLYIMIWLDLNLQDKLMWSLIIFYLFICWSGHTSLVMN